MSKKAKAAKLPTEPWILTAIWVLLPLISQYALECLGSLKEFFSKKALADDPYTFTDGVQYIVPAIPLLPLLCRWSTAWKTSLPAFFCCGVILAPFLFPVDDSITTGIAFVVYIAICATSPNIVCSSVGDAIFVLVIYITTLFFYGMRGSAIMAVALRLVQREEESKIVTGVVHKLHKFVRSVDKIIDEMYLILILVYCSWITYRCMVTGDLIPVCPCIPVWLWVVLSCISEDLFCDNQTLYNHIFTLIVFCGSGVFIAVSPILKILYCETTMRSYTRYMKDFVSLPPYQNNSYNNLCTVFFVVFYTLFVAMFLFENISSCVNHNKNPRYDQWKQVFRKTRLILHRNMNFIGICIFLAWLLHWWNVYSIAYSVVSTKKPQDSRFTSTVCGIQGYPKCDEPHAAAAAEKATADEAAADKAAAAEKAATASAAADEAPADEAATDNNLLIYMTEQAVKVQQAASDTTCQLTKGLFGCADQKD